MLRLVEYLSSCHISLMRYQFDVFQAVLSCEINLNWDGTVPCEYKGELFVTFGLMGARLSTILYFEFLFHLR